MRILQLPKDACGQLLSIADEPKPNVSIQEELQSCRASHSSSSLAGEIMSPRNFIEPSSEPIQAERSWTDDGGTTSATGLPWRVMQIGFLVLRTCSSKARHLALNCEIGISSMATHLVKIIDHGQIIGQFYVNRYKNGVYIQAFSNLSREARAD